MRDDGGQEVAGDEEKDAQVDPDQPGEERVGAGEPVRRAEEERRRSPSASQGGPPLGQAGLDDTAEERLLPDPGQQGEQARCRRRGAGEVGRT